MPPARDHRPIVVIACQVFQPLLDKHLPPRGVASITYLDYGLHRIPRNLNAILQGMINDLPEPSLVVCAYGLCGNGLNGIRSGRHTLLIPRADDCIAILLGSYRAYQQEFQANPGTYYLSKGWLESGSNPLSEYQSYLKRFSQEQADWIMDQQYRNYRRLVFVAHTPQELEKYRPQVEAIARFCQRWGMRYEEISGSDEYIRRLVGAAQAPDQTGEDFLLIPPGGKVTQSLFIR